MAIRAALLVCIILVVLPAFSDGFTTPAASGSAAWAATANAESRVTMEAADTRFLEISTATVGGAADRTKGAIIRRTSLC